MYKFISLVGPVIAAAFAYKLMSWRNPHPASDIFLGILVLMAIQAIFHSIIIGGKEADKEPTDYLLPSFLVNFVTCMLMLLCYICLSDEIKDQLTQTRSVLIFFWAAIASGMDIKRYFNTK